MKNIRDSIKLFRFNIVNTLLFEIFITTVSFAVLIPLYYAFINLAINLSGISYMTKENVGKFFKAPSTYALIIIMMLFISMYIMINVSAISYSYYRADRLKKTGPVRMALVGIRSALRMLRPKNYPMIFLLLCYLPVIGNVILTIRLLNIKAPYVIDILSFNMYVTISVLAVYALIVILSLRHVYVIHIYNVDKVDYFEAARLSKETLKGKKFRTLLDLFGWLIITIGIPGALLYIYNGPVLDSVIKSALAIRVTGMIYETVRIVFAGIYVLFGLPFIYSYICNSYYNHVLRDEELPSIDDLEEYDAKKTGKIERRIFAVILIVAIILDGGFYLLKRYNVISVNADYMNKVKVTAHRGDSKKAPENTLAAFEKAIENGADVIELDVRQTKDGEIVIMHDENLKRTCGVDAKVGDLTYAELQRCSAGVTFKGKNKDIYRNEKIPTLRDAFDLIGDRAEVNIELKPAKTDTDLEKRVAEIINEYDYYDNCVVASLVYKSIKKTKKADPKIKTIYVMAMAMGDFYNLEYADGFSIKHRFINREVIKNSHKVGKEVYAWTIDDKEVLENMMLLDVDSIITNNPGYIRRAMYENYYGDTLIKRINAFLDSQL
ncbi:Membrane domain of glycerophosphoryl diester phosphodiesterase [Lachnospiraceae bacterium]|nr:Membrane domain of glycerophosphoryl diester phosphodiesterase [Lachnospiraceae bacterium]